jgi:hypothetical protein
MIDSKRIITALAVASVALTAAAWHSADIALVCAVLLTVTGTWLVTETDND